MTLREFEWASGQLTNFRRDQQDVVMNFDLGSGINGFSIFGKSENINFYLLYYRLK